MSELSDGQHKIQTLQSQVQGELPEDYRNWLWTELEQAEEQAQQEQVRAKHKLMETADKFENSLAPLVTNNPSEGGSVLCKFFWPPPHSLARETSAGARNGH